MAKQTSQINIAFLTKGDGEVAKAFKRLRGEMAKSSSYYARNWFI